MLMLLVKVCRFVFAIFPFVLLLNSNVIPFLRTSPRNIHSHSLSFFLSVFYDRNFFTSLSARLRSVGRQCAVVAGGDWIWRERWIVIKGGEAEKNSWETQQPRVALETSQFVMLFFVFASLLVPFFRPAPPPPHPTDARPQQFLSFPPEERKSPSKGRDWKASKKTEVGAEQHRRRFFKFFS